MPDIIGSHVAGLIGLLIGGAALVLLGAFVARVPDLDLQLRLPHRGVTHSLVAAAAVTALIGVLVSSLKPSGAVVMAVVTGAAYLSHLAADGFNPMPEAVFWPMPRYRPRWLPSVREDSLAGRAVEGIVWMAILGGIAWRVMGIFGRR
jgi:membrane-bound metal-dependent hydrolase YbcI (DUF457 family)